MPKSTTVNNVNRRQNVRTVPKPAMATTIDVKPPLEEPPGYPQPAPITSIRVVRVDSDADRIIMAILIIVFPPLGVMFKDKGCSCAVCLNILLLFLFVLPAYCHAAYHCFIRGYKEEVTTQFVA